MLVLVTGNAGFIGFHTAKRLLERGDSVVGIDVVNDYYDPALKQARLKALDEIAARSARQLSVHSCRPRRASYVGVMFCGSSF